MTDETELLEDGQEQPDIESAEPADAASPAEDAGDVEAPPTPEQSDHTVPLAALEKARAAARQAREEAQQISEKFERANKRFEEWQAAQEQQARANQYDEDPLSYLRNEVTSLREQLSGFNAQQQQAAELARQQNEFVGRYQAAAHEFAQSQPDFMDAYKHLMETRTQELQTMGYSKPEAMQLVQNEERMIVQRALQDDANPAERIYRLAQLRGAMGAAPSSGNGGAAPSGNGGAEQFARAKEGQKLTSRMSGGAAPKGKINLAALADMSEEEFAKATAGEKWKNMWGD